jgi:hypothetical protein
MSKLSKFDLKPTNKNWEGIGKCHDNEAERAH